MNRINHWLVPVLLCIGGSLSAQDPQWGVHGSVNLPQGDLKKVLDSRMGFTAGGHIGIYLEDGHEIRPRADYTRYDGGSFSETSLTFKNTVVALGLGADYLYHLDGRQRGVYVLGGLGYQWWTIEPRQGEKTHENGLSFQAGGGYRFNSSVAAEVTFSSSKFRKDEGRANALTVGMSLRF